jgi:hypothetical protein
MYDKELIDQIRPGMDLCSSDHKKWGDVDNLEWPEGDGSEPIVTGHVQSDGRSVYVPASAVIEIRGGKCVVFNAPLEEADAQGWEQAPDSLAAKTT